MAKTAKSGSKRTRKGKAEAAEKPERVVVARNRRALHRFVIMEKHECGIVLTGPEVKSLRNGQGVITEAFARIRGTGVWLINMEIGAYTPAAHVEQLTRRTRKLLLHGKEIRKLERKLDDSGTTLIPLQVYFTRGLAKVEIALARGAREHDKRQRTRERDAKREIRAKMQTQNRGRKNRR